MACLHNLRKSTMGFHFFSGKNEPVIKIEQNEQAAHDQSPLWKQAQRRVERHPAKKSKKQRGTERCQQAGRVAYHKYEEDDEMSSMPPQLIRAQERPNQQHRCAWRADQIGQNCSQSENYRIDQWRAGVFALHMDSAGNHEYRSQESQKREVIQDRMPKQTWFAWQHDGNDR